MNRIQKRILIVLVVLVVAVLGLFLYDNIKTTVKAPKAKPVKYSVVDKLYSDMDKKKSTKDKKYVSKLYGYSSDDKGNITMYTKEGYVMNNIVYSLDDKNIGSYDKSKINDILEQGTTKVYKFNKKDKDYVLEKNKKKTTNN